MAVQSAMTMQSIRIAKTVMAMGTSGTRTRQGLKSTERDFSTVLGSKQTTEKNHATHEAGKAVGSDKKQGEAVQLSGQEASKTEHTDASQKTTGSEATDASTKQDAVEEADLTAAKNGQAKDEMLSEDELRKLIGILNELVTVLMGTLSMDEQELLDAAETMQLQLTDLFEPDKRNAFFLQASGVEAPELLVDEALYHSFDKLQAAWNEILQGEALVSPETGVQTKDTANLEQELKRVLLESMQEMMGAEPSEVTKEAVIDFRQELSKQNGESVTDFLSGNPNADEPDPLSLSGSEAMASSTEEGSDDAGTKQELGQAALFLQKLLTVGKANRTEGILPVADAYDMLDIAAQIIEQVKLQIRPESTRMELQLNPESLGKVELSITSKNGELSAKMNVQNDQVKEAVEAQMQVLRETLEAQGLKVESIEVTVAEFGFRFQDESGGASQQQSRQQRSSQAFSEDTVTEEQSFSDVSDVMKELNGNSVDYVA